VLPPSAVKQTAIEISEGVCRLEMKRLGEIGKGLIVRARLVVCKGTIVKDQGVVWIPI
jgi:hypothetical protein